MTKRPRRGKRLIDIGACPLRQVLPRRPSFHFPHSHFAAKSVFLLNVNTKAETDSAVELLSAVEREANYKGVAGPIWVWTSNTLVC